MHFGWIVANSECMVRRFFASEDWDDGLVCANVFGLDWSSDLLA
jgi:hypothetical protein